MAMSIAPLLIGVDVSKATLSVCTEVQGSTQDLPNQSRAIERWLDTLPAGPVGIAMEATNTFHLELLTRAYRRNHRVYLIDGYRLSRYRDSIGGRAKTDASDAQLLRRYLAHEGDALRAWTPPPAGYAALQRLLHRRSTLVRARVALQQSLAELPALKTSAKALLKQFRRLDAVIQRRLRKCVEEAQWTTEVRRCQAIEGLGNLTATAMTAAFHRAPFRSSDAFIAFIGLDVRVRDSGRTRGKRKLTKAGDPELRRLLFLAAMCACQRAPWKPYYQACIQRGLARTAALVILARKLARVAFALLKNKTDYQPKTTAIPCQAT